MLQLEQKISDKLRLHSERAWCKGEQTRSQKLSPFYKMIKNNEASQVLLKYYFCLSWAFTAQSTQWGHVERGQFT